MKWLGDNFKQTHKFFVSLSICKVLAIFTDVLDSFMISGPSILVEIWNDSTILQSN